MFSNGFWDFLQVLLPRKEGRKEGSKEARKQGSKAARQQGSKEARKQEASKRGREEGRKEQCISAGMLTILCFLWGRRCALPAFLNFSRSLKTKPASQFASDWPAKHLTLKRKKDLDTNNSW